MGHCRVTAWSLLCSLSPPHEIGGSWRTDAGAVGRRPSLPWPGAALCCTCAAPQCTTRSLDGCEPLLPRLSRATHHRPRFCKQQAKRHALKGVVRARQSCTLHTQVPSACSPPQPGWALFREYRLSSRCPVPEMPQWGGVDFEGKGRGNGAINGLAHCAAQLRLPPGGRRGGKMVMVP